jgi:uncharacterized RDD family membrane protein YckC
MGPVLAASLLADAVWHIDPALSDVVIWIPVVWWLAVLWSIANDRLRQGWHDRVAGTFVVNHRGPIDAGER